MATAMAVLDGAIVNVALPTIAHDLSIPNAESVWIVNSFQLAVTVSLLPLSALGDSLGYRRVYWPGLALFTLASFACAIAPTLATLALARARPGTRRSRHHERQHRPRAIHLSGIPPRPRRRQHRARCGRVLGRKPDGRSRDPLGRLVAVAISHQRSDRRGRAPDGGAQPAGHAGGEAQARSAQHHPQRPDLRPADHRHQQPRRRERTVDGVGGARRVRGDRRRVRPQAVEARDAVAAARSPQPAGVCAVAGDVDLLVRRPEPGARGAAVLLRGHPAPLRDRDRAPDDPLAARRPP